MSSRQLSKLLEISPSAALRSENYSNSVEKLALESEDLSATSINLASFPEESSEDNLYEFSRGPDEEYLIPDELDTPTFNESKLPSDYELDIEEKSNRDIYSKKSQIRVDSRSYAERNLEREFRKDPAEVDLDRVRNLAENVYSENSNFMEYLIK